MNPIPPSKCVIAVAAFGLAVLGSALALLGYLPGTETALLSTFAIACAGLVREYCPPAWANGILKYVTPKNVETVIKDAEAVAKGA